MSSRSLRLVLIVVACAGAVGTALASGPRLLALGGDGAYLEDAAQRARLVREPGRRGRLAGGGVRGVRPGGRLRPHLARPAVHRPGRGRLRPAGRRTATSARPRSGGIRTAPPAAPGALERDDLADAWQLMFARRLGGFTGAFSIRHGSGRFEDMWTDVPTPCATSSAWACAWTCRRRPTWTWPARSSATEIDPIASELSLLDPRAPPTLRPARPRLRPGGRRPRAGARPGVPAGVSAAPRDSGDDRAPACGMRAPA